MKRFLISLVVLTLCMMAVTPSLLACAAGEGARLHEIVLAVQEALDQGGEYPLHKDIATYDLLVEGLGLLDVEGVAPEDVTAFRALKFVYDKEEKRIRLYIDATHLTFGMSTNTAHAYWEEEWQQIVALLAAFDGQLADADNYDELDKAISDLVASVALVPTYVDVVRGWTEAVDAWVADADDTWTSGINAGLEAFNLPLVSLPAYSITLEDSSYLAGIDSLRSYYSQEDWTALSAAHQAILDYFNSDTDYHERYVDPPEVILAWRTAVQEATIVLDQAAIDLARSKTNAHAALQLYLQSSFLADYSSEEQARIRRIVAQADARIDACTTQQEVAAVVADCGETIRATQQSPKKKLSWSTILAIVLAGVAVVLFVVYFVIKKKETASTKRVDSQVFLAQLTQEIEQAKAQKEREEQERQEVQEQEKAQEEPAESVPAQGEESECPQPCDESPVQEGPQEEDKEEQP